MAVMPSWCSLLCAVVTVLCLLGLWGAVRLRRVEEELRALRSVVERLLPAPSERSAGLPRRPLRRRVH